MNGTRILIVGAGGLGVPAAMALGRTGIATLGLVDPDPVELSNLARQVIYRRADVGKAKVEAARRRLARYFPRLDIETHACRLESANAAGLVAKYDFVIDGTDDPGAKFLINDACLLAARPFAYGGVVGLRGQAMTVLPGETACLRCLFEEPPDEAEVASCREAGILGPVAGAIGEVLAAEAGSWIRGYRPELSGRILTYEGAGQSRIRLVPVYPRPGCKCGAARQGANVLAPG